MWDSNQSQKKCEVRDLDSSLLLSVKINFVSIQS